MQNGTYDHTPVPYNDNTLLGSYYCCVHYVDFKAARDEDGVSESNIGFRSQWFPLFLIASAEHSKYDTAVDTDIYIYIHICMNAR